MQNLKSIFSNIRLLATLQGTYLLFLTLERLFHSSVLQNQKGF